MQVKTRGVHIFAPVREAHREVRLVGTFVARKSRIAIDAKQRSARRTSIGHQVRADFTQWHGEIADEPQRRLSCRGFELLFVSEEPVTIIAPLEAGEKAKKFGREVSRHCPYVKEDTQEK